jgi:hypothetical protein
MEKHEELLKLPTDVPSDSKIALEKIFSSSISYKCSNYNWGPGKSNDSPIDIT